VFGPIFLNQLPFGAVGGVALSIMKQFGTGVIVSTAFVHVSLLNLASGDGF
jgi:zinc transporter 1/2/3